MPDFDRRSRASFISSNEGGTPVSRTRWWMNIRSSYCFLVSIAFPNRLESPKSEQIRNANRSTLVLAEGQRMQERARVGQLRRDQDAGRRPHPLHGRQAHEPCE